MQITSVHHCQETQTVTVRTTNSSEALKAKCLGTIATNSVGQPTHLVLDRLLFSENEMAKMSGPWTAKGCYVTELLQNAA